MQIFLSHLISVTSVVAAGGDPIVRNYDEIANQ
eukprot:COSAG02_NODE_3288_length_7000_cov_1414.390958_4_plen_33_part_00